jgi:AcrR family transcriptional regulator
MTYVTIRHVSRTVNAMEQKGAPPADGQALAIRREPEQARSRAGVDAIVQAAAELLATSGVDQITMTSIAEHAELSKAAIYRYFPSKNAVIRALALRTFEEQREIISARLPTSDPPATVIIDGLRSYLQQHRTEPFRAQLRAAIRADPELSRLDLADSRHNAAAIAQYLEGTNDAPTDVEARVLLILELTDSAVRLMTMVNDAEAQRILDDFCALAASYLLTAKRSSPEEQRGDQARRNARSRRPK